MIGKWNLIPKKCFVIHASKKNQPLSFNYSLHSHKLEVVKNGEYLGVNSSHNLDWGPHLDHITCVYAIFC
jgi:hypothetical protein